MNRLDQTFARLAENNSKGLFPFIVAGQGGMSATIDVIGKFQELGASGIELGFPFTDPIADGPVICGAFAEAVEAGVTVHEIFKVLQEHRDEIQIPLIAMVSASIVYRIGLEKFFDQAVKAGIAGFIIPDLSLEEAPAAKELIEARGLKLAMLVSPTSSQERQTRIAELASGFIYYMSVAGITGERTKLPEELPDNVRKLKELSGKPVLVGFGIKDAQQVKLVCSVADGAIVGSAFVRRMDEAIAEDAAGAAEKMGVYLQELLAGLPG